jgi:hypothetical protein
MSFSSIDPIGQGERLQYPDGQSGSRLGAGVGERLHLGNQQLLVGENFAQWRAWDAIRALDYLENAPGGRSAPHRCHRQLRRWYGDDLALRAR